MRIAIMIPLFPPRWLAGTEIATYNIAKHLARRGYEVHVITALDKGLPKESMEEGFYVHRIFWRKIRFAGVISFWTKVFLVLRKVNPDMIHVQSIEMCIPAFIAKKLMRKPYVVWGQGSDVYLPGKFIKSISKLVLKSANKVIALTDDMKKEMQKICSRDVSVIPNGIDLSSFEDLSRKEARSRLQIKDDEKVILFVGTLRPVKGIRYLIEAMRLIKDKNESTKLFLVGDGEEREYLKNLVKGLILEECVRFIGKVPNEKVPECMVASDVFVLPSLSEGFPVVILEAMASGLPIIATKVTGLLEIVKDGKNGILVESKSPDEIAEKVLLILGDDELRERISENNRKEAKRYSWDSAVDKLEEIYQKSPVNLSSI
ncbi:MAG: glycosyltransferase family 4 protein [Methanosarcinales archaeon]